MATEDDNLHTISFRSPVAYGQKVWIIEDLSGTNAPYEPCPACGGTAHLTGRDDVEYPCSGYGDGWRCIDGQRCPIESAPTICEGKVTGINVDLYGPEQPYRLVCMVLYAVGSRQKTGTYGLGDLYLTKKAAGQRLFEKIRDKG